jgi:hypothetical protein
MTRTPNKLPRITPPGTPARSRWHSANAEWVSDAWPVDGGFLIVLETLYSHWVQPGTKITFRCWGEWAVVKEWLRCELQLRESDYYTRVSRMRG